MGPESEADATPPFGAWEPRLHVTGTSNWINDPNGPVHWNGVYHLFFQANPAAPRWGRPQWGHVSSDDLVRWRRHPTAPRRAR
jgi:beta-fructofuranosidase